MASNIHMDDPCLSLLRRSGFDPLSKKFDGIDLFIISCDILHTGSLVKSLLKCLKVIIGTAHQIVIKGLFD